MKQRKKRGRLSPAAENNLSDLFSGMTYAPAGTYGMGQAASLTVVRRSMLSSATNFNGSSHLVTVNFSYVMKNNETMILKSGGELSEFILGNFSPHLLMMAKRLLGVILASLVSIFMAKSQDLVFDGITPAPGSEISSFNFVLKFDLSKIIEANGPADYGIGWVGFHNDKLLAQEKSVTLYEGPQEDGTVIGRLCTSNYTGKTAGFEATDIIELNFEGTVPKPGVKYTMVITNQFKVFTVAKGSSPISNSTFDCFKTPIVYEFIGGQASSESVSLTDCSLSSGQSLESIDNVKFNFNIPVTANNNNPVIIKEGDDTVATSLSSQVSEDGLCVTYLFDNVPLYKKHNYSVVLPAHAVKAVSDENKGNEQFTVNVSGTSVQYFSFVSSTPEENSTSIFSSIKAIFEVPAGLEIFKKEGVICNLSATLYKNSISEENLVGTLTGVGNGNSVTWTNTFALEPSTTYIVFVPKGQFPLYITSDDKYNYETGNGEVNILLNTPSVTESGIPKVEFQAPVLGIYNDKGDNVTLSNGDKVNEITTIDFLLKDLRYSYNGEYISPACWDKNQIEIYDITNGTPVLVTKAILSPQSYETTTYYYVVYRAAVNSLFYEGHKYRLVVPAGTVSVGKKPLRYYAGNEEYVVDFEGTSPTTVELISCSLADNTELSELSNIIWKFKGNFVYNTELSVIEMTGSIGGSRPTFVSSLNGETTVRAFFNATTGGPQQLNTKQTYTIILPEGLLYAAEDPSIKNEEMKINIIPIEKVPEVVEPEYVNVEIVTNDFMTTTQKAVKGKIFTYSMTFDSADWKLTSATQGDKNLAVTNDILVCPALSENTKIDLNVEYKGPWASDEDTTGIWQVPNSEIRIFRDGNFIVVEGVSPDNTINVYNVAGMLVNTTHVSDGHNLVRLTVAPDQLYIVMVDGVAAKIQM